MKILRMMILSSVFFTISSLIIKADDFPLNKQFNFPDIIPNIEFGNHNIKLNDVGLLNTEKSFKLDSVYHYQNIFKTTDYSDEKFIYYYNEHNLLDKQIVKKLLDSNWVHYQTYSYEYDEDLNLIKSSLISESGLDTGAYTKYYYNDNNQRVREEFYVKIQNELILRTTYAYEYDEIGNLINIFDYLINPETYEEMGWYQSKYNYNENSNLINKTLLDISADTILPINKTDYYYEDNRLVESKYYNFSDNWHYRNGRKYFYNDNGDVFMRKRINYDEETNEYIISEKYGSEYIYNPNINLSNLAFDSRTYNRTYDNTLLYSKNALLDYYEYEIVDGKKEIWRHVKYFYSDITTSVEDNFISESGISVVPNPASDYIEIMISSDSKGACPLVSSNEIEIYDVLGNVVWKFNSVASKSTSVPINRDTYAGGGQVRIDITHLPRGVYFVRIGGRVEKFVKR